MLITNVDVSYGLTNGTMGTVRNIITRSRDEKLMIEAIFVEFNSPKVELKLCFISNTRM